MGELKKEADFHSERYEKLLRQSQLDIAALKRDNDDKMRLLIEGFKKDMTTIDKEVSYQRAQLTQQNTDLKIKLEKALKDGVELRNLLEAAAKSDARNEALLKGIKLAQDEEKRNLANEKA